MAKSSVIISFSIFQFRIKSYQVLILLNKNIIICFQDNRLKHKSKSTDVDDEHDGIDFLAEGTQPLHTDISYGKDAKLCSPTSKDAQLIFGEEMDLDNHSVKSFDSAQDPHDPWTRQVPHTPKHSLGDKSPKPAGGDSEKVTMSEMALAGRHRRTASECLTSTTDIPYSSSVESFDSIPFRLRSPLNISLEERDLLPKHPSPHHSESKKGILDRFVVNLKYLVS